MKSILFLSLTLSAMAFAQPSADRLPDAVTSAIDAYINRSVGTQKIPGVALGVVKDGKLIYAKGYGVANVEHKIPVTPETMFQSGSVGKAFTVIAVLMLADDRVIDLDSPIKTYIPESPPAWDRITVRHMLEHTSGMTGYPDGLDFRKDYTHKELLDLYSGIPLEFEPGTRRGYSNVAFGILGMLIEKVSGKTYGEFLQARIFGPLQMTSSRIISESDIVAGRAAGYRLVRGEIKNQEWVAPSHNNDAAGSLYLNVIDMARFEAGLREAKLLSAKGFENMWNPIITKEGATEPWGMSWSVSRENGRQLVAHSGGWQGFTANFTRYPEKGIAVIIFTNLRGASPDRLSMGVLGLVAPELSIAGAIPIKSTEPTLDALITKLVQDIAGGKPHLGLYRGAALDMMQKHADKATAEFRSYGALKGVDLVDYVKKPNGNRQVRHRLNFVQKQVILILDVDANGKVLEMDMRRE